MEAHHNRILVIEDDPAVAQGLQQALRRDGFTVAWKSTAKDGLSYLQNHPADLVLLDVRLPDGSGFDVCRKMRQKKMRMPVIILTVQNEEIDKVVGLEAGADDYMTKPFGIRELTSRVRAQLRRAYGELSAADADILYIHDLTVDRSLGQVTRGDQVLNLTPIEFRLLVYLARHQGLALSRAQIIENVWGYEGQLGDDKTVNVHIRHLRKKIETDPSKPAMLLTVPGIGYRLSR
jgi:DNA-binding response OmpR family regulator